MNSLDFKVGPIDYESSSDGGVGCDCDEDDDNDGMMMVVVMMNLTPKKLRAISCM